MTEWGDEGTGAGLFLSLSGVAVDDAGRVYVTDFYNNRVQKFGGNGSFAAAWGSFGSGDGEFHYPSGVAVAANGRVYVAELENQRIQLFEPA